MTEISKLDVEGVRAALAGQGLSRATVDGLCPALSERADASAVLSDTAGAVAIVGGGLSGAEAARIHAAGRARVVVLEKELFYGGVWVTTANTASRVQVDPVSFRPLHDTTPLPDDDPDNPFGSFYRCRADVLEQLAQDITTAQLVQSTVFGASVDSFQVAEDGSVEVTISLAGAGQDGAAALVTVPFAELHIRTGSLTDHVGGAEALGLDDSMFPGRVVRGIADDIADADLADAKVVIVGLGAFAVENVRRALTQGAKSITVLTRNADKLLFPEAATYVLRHALNCSAATELSQDELDAMWARVYGLVETGASIAGLSDLLLNPATLTQVDGLNHFIFTNGLPAMSSNIILLAAAYGLVTISVDEIASFTETGVQTKGGAAYDADVVMTCLGFGTRDTLLAGHSVSDSWFIDGHRNLTHNLRGDRVNGANVIGPRVDASNFLISYYEDAVEYERTIRRICDDTDGAAIFDDLVSMAPVSESSPVEDVDYFTTLVLSDKLLRCTHPDIAAILEDNRVKRVALYDLVLPDDTFWTRDALIWNRLSAALAARAGLPAEDVIPYPFSPSVDS